MRTDARIYVAGHLGLVGSALVRRLDADGFRNVLSPARGELDLCDQAAVRGWFAGNRPEYVFLAAAKVGGILANSTRPADFIRDNLSIQSNVIESACANGCRKLLFLGSSCIYPKHAAQPLREEYLLGGPLEPTNEAYAIAKIAGLKMCQAYRRQFGFDAIVAMPTNLYGPGDNYDPLESHVVAALLRRFIDAADARAQKVEVWGSGEPRREFLHVDDLAGALLHLMQVYSDGEPVNVGTGVDIRIADLASLVARTVGFAGEIVFDRSKPDGTPVKRLDVSRMLALGWRAGIPLDRGLAEVAAGLQRRPPDLRWK